MSLVICRKIVFEIKILQETCQILARFRIQKVFTKMSVKFSSADQKFRL